MRAGLISASRALWRFSFLQTLRGAIIMGLVAGIMFVGQGVGYQKTYPDAVSQAKFAASLSAAPALGLLYGDSKNLSAGPAGYMVYRVTGFMSFVVALWSLLTVTRLLRGNEEEG